MSQFANELNETPEVVRSIELSELNVQLNSISQDKPTVESSVEDVVVDQFISPILQPPQSAQASSPPSFPSPR